jgi:FkbM family methyltransferase
MFDKINLLKQQGFYPDAVLDIGAYHGHWTNSMLQIYQNANYYLFEAIDYNELKSRYNDNSKIKKFNVLLFDKVTEVDWYEMRNTGDSIFKENTIWFKDCVPVKRQTIDLDSFIAENNILKEEQNILVKIDCQGAEIPILKGSMELLKRVKIIILEVPLFGQYNKGVPDFVEHLVFMKELGYIAYDILESHYIEGKNRQVDIMFCKTN